MKKDNTSVKNNVNNIANCYITSKRENGFYNLSISVGDIKNIKVRLCFPNTKLSCLLHHVINKDNK